MHEIIMAAIVAMCVSFKLQLQFTQSAFVNSKWRSGEITLRNAVITLHEELVILRTLA
jgi:hypothetical protein